MKKILYFIAACVVLLSACKKGETVENTEYEKIAPGDPKYAYIKVLNLTPGSPVANYYMDGVKFSSSLSSSGVENAGYTYNGIYPDLGYATTSPGAHTLTAKIIPTAAANANVEVFKTSITPAAGKYYTLLTSGVYDATNKKIPSSILISDERPATDTTKVFVRLINLYNGGPNLDMVIGDVSTGPKLVSNVAVGTASGWAEISKPGPGAAPVIKFWFNNSVTSVPLNAAAYGPALSKGRAYTIYIRGVLGNATYPMTTTFYTTFY